MATFQTSEVLAEVLQVSSNQQLPTFAQIDIGDGTQYARLFVNAGNDVRLDIFSGYAALVTRIYDSNSAINYGNFNVDNPQKFQNANPNGYFITPDSRLEITRLGVNNKLDLTILIYNSPGYTLQFYT